MSVLNNTTVNGVVTQTEAASLPNHLVRLGEAQALWATQFQGAWSGATTYAAGQLVTDGRSLYIANQTTLNQQPSANAPSVWRLAAQGGTDGVAAYLYIAYASDASGTGFSLTPGSGLTYVALLKSTTLIASPTAGNFSGLWKKYVGADGAAGAAGSAAFNYVAYASDSSGTGFSLTPGNGLTQVAFLSVTTAIGSLTAGNFAGLWQKYVGTDGAAGAAGAAGASAFLYVAYASDTSGTGFSLTPGSGLNFIAFLTATAAISSPSASDFTGRWTQYVGATGATGATGAAGAAGASAYLYIAYASDTSGTGFSLTPGSGLNYVAFLSSNAVIASPLAANFAGLWKNYASPFAVSGALTFSGGTLGLNAASANTANYVVQRDSSGNFAGNCVTATSVVVGSATLAYAGSALTINTAVTVAGALTLTGLSGILKAGTGVVAGSADTNDLPEGTVNLATPAGNAYFSRPRVLATPLTGLTSTNVLLATDTVLAAFGKLDNILGGNFPAGTVTGNFSITGTLNVTGTTTLATGLSGILKATSGVVSGAATTANLPEDASYLYYTNARADARIAAARGAVNGIAPLDSSGKVPLANLYAYGATTYGAASQAAMLALSAAKQGDVALRSDTNVAYVLTNNTPAVLGSWAAWVYPVLSVNGATGTVVLNADTVAEGSTNLYFTSTRADARIAAARGAALGICPLDANQLVPAVNLPPVGNGIWTVNSQSTQTNLTSALKGDLANRTDQNLTYILSNNTPSSFASWVPLLYPVSSVNGLTGAVTLTTTTVAEGTGLYFTNARCLATTLTGYAAGAGTVTAADTVLTALQKVAANAAAASSAALPLAGGTLTGALNFSGTSNRGVIVNQLSTTQINALGTSSTYNGTIVYDTTLNQIKALANGTWVSLAAGASLPLAAGSSFPLTGALYFQDGLAYNIYFGSNWVQRTSNSNVNFDLLNGSTVVLTCDTSNNVTLPNGNLRLGAHQVLTTQQSAIADFSPVGGWSDGTAWGDFSNLYSKVNTLLAMLRTHGLMAT